uniref:Uncharacterized protein n=1 Tax=Physcomitrium patens TaxID=3218 RepID=A0A2K1K5P3_PHYPA|nr:hypothetical protein PHYPA_010996 [Physcomitrium patens]
MQKLNRSSYIDRERIEGWRWAVCVALLGMEAPLNRIVLPSRNLVYLLTLLQIIE